MALEVSAEHAIIPSSLSEIRGLKAELAEHVDTRYQLETSPGPTPTSCIVRFVSTASQRLTLFLASNYDLYQLNASLPMP